MQKLKNRKVILLLFTLFFNLFLFKTIGTSGVTLFIIGSWIALILSHIKRCNLKNSARLIAVTSIPLLIAAVGLTLRASWIAQVVLAASAVWYLAALAYSLSRQRSTIPSFLELTLFPFLYLKTYTQNLKKLARKSEPIDESIVSSFSYNQKKITSVFTGVVIALPVIGILAWLLSSADPVFNTFLKEFFHFDFEIRRWVARALLSLTFMLGVAPVFLSTKDKTFTNPLHKIYSHQYVIEFSVLILLVALTLGTFLVVQWPYVFASVDAETSLSQFGVATYSEYVKKGFAELLITSALLYSLLWYGLLIFRKVGEKTRSILRLIQIAVLAELSIFLISIFRRVWLYQAHHGMSLTRVYGGILLMIVSAMVFTLLLRHFWKKSFVKIEFGVISLAVVFVAFFNIENNIAKHHAPTVNGRVDHVYLVQLSADGIEGWEKSFSHAQEILLEKDHYVQEGSQSATIIPKKSRQEIAYAGFIIKKLFKHKMELLDTYGTPDEIRSEYIKLNSLHRDFVIKELHTLSQTQDASRSAIEQATRPSVIGTLQSQAVDQKLFLVDYYSEFTQKIEENTEKIPLSRQQPALYNLAWKPLMYEFDQNCSGTAICQNLFYEIYDPNTLLVDSSTQTEKLLNWNSAEHKAYQQLKQSITFEQLVTLEFAYVSYADKINSQPKEERSFEVDTQVHPPLLSF